MKKKLTLFFISIVVFATQRTLQAQTPDTVKVGCYFLSLHDFNFREKEYTARFWMWLLYDNPEIDFANDVEIPNAKRLNFDAIISDSLAGEKWVQLKITSVIKQSWEVGNYPFDKQKLSLVIENSKYDARTVVFVPDTAGQYYDPDFTIQGWHIRRFHVSTGVSHYSTGFGDTSLEKPASDYAKMIVEIDLERNAWGLFFKLFLGMYVAFAITFVSFWIDPEHTESRFALPVGGLFTAVGNKYVIDSYLPESSGITMVDMLHGITFIAIFFTIFFSAVSLRYEDEGQMKLGQRTDRITRTALGIVYLLLNIGIVVYSIYQ
jgi:hypothetical protein